MAKNNKKANALFRDEVIERISKMLIDDFGEEVIKTASNTIAFPFVNELNSDEWIKIVVSVPAGSRSGDAFDGYEQGEDYVRATQAREAKEKEKQIAKEKQFTMEQKKREIAKKGKRGAV